MALSLLLHGSALVPLAFAGAVGAPGDEPALVVEIIRAAPAPANATEPGIDLPSNDEPPPIEASEIAGATVELPTPVEPPPIEASEIAPAKIELPAPNEPPPLDIAEIKPPTPPKEQPKPPARAKAAPTRAAQKPAVTQTASPPGIGTDQATQTAAAAALPAIVFEHHPRFRVPPRPATYPPRSIELGHQGEALVRVRLDTSGSAVEIVLWRTTGHEMLDQAALAAVRGWHFMPAMRNGHAIAAWVEIPVRFHLR
jgi:protein TonB